MRLCPLGRRMAPCSSSCSAIVISCCWPGVSKKVIGLPWPSQRRWILVPKPPWLRPKASCSGVLFLPQPRADGRAQCSHPQNGSPNPPRPACPPAPAVRSAPDPTPRRPSSAGSGCTRSARVHNAQANHARVRRSARPTTSRSPSCGDRVLDDRYAASAPVTAV